MKNLRIYILLLIYTLSCIGIMVDFHYCGGELESIALYSASEEDCCGEHEDDKKNCCDDKYIFVSTDDTEGAKAYTVSNIDFSKIITAVYLQPDKLLFNGFVRGETMVFLNHAPPKNEPSLYIKNCVLLI